MNARERFLQIARFERKNDPMWFFFDAWYKTFLRWKEEGMPVNDMDTLKEIHDYFLGDGNHYEFLIPNSAIKGIGPLNNPPWVPPLEPPFEEKILEEDERTIIKKVYDGTTVKMSKSNPRGLPQYLDLPVKDRKTWNKFKKRLNPYTRSRFPDGWDIMTDKTVSSFPLKKELEGKSFSERDFTLFAMVLSLIGMPRNYMGVINLSYAMYDDPTLVEEMVDWQTYFAMEVLKQVFKAGIKIDCAFFWEDMAGKNGSIFPISFVKKAMVPRYKRVTELLRNNGVEVINLDSDGNTEELIPLWIEGGINCHFPLEVQAGMDPIKLRKKYGKNLILTGGVDKRELAKGKKEIDGQVAIVKELIKDGGYFVQADHHMPPDIPFENVVYFVNEVNKLCEYDEFRKEVII